MIEVLLYIIILATAFPAGLLLARLCDDELIVARRWFKKILWVIGFAGLIVVLLEVLSWVGIIPYKLDLLYPVLFTLIYFAILLFISISKSNDAKFMKGVKNWK